MPDALRIASIRHRFRKPPAYPELALGRSQQQQTAIRGLIAALKFYKANSIRYRAGRTWVGCVFSISVRHKSNIARRVTLIIDSFGLGGLRAT
ncbi:MAG TPA: hypothetical protein VEH02_02705 [Pseudolabrys sp.]|nr:hypothetical protein [Pseudolabrys sp.]